MMVMTYSEIHYSVWFHVVPAISDVLHSQKDLRKAASFWCPTGKLVVSLK